MSDQQWFIPSTVSTRGDVGRLLRELETIDQFLNQANIRQPGTNVQPPKTSNVFSGIVAKNNLNMLHESDRQTLKNFLVYMREKAPMLHVSFSVEASPDIVSNLTDWVRQHIHNYAILQIGLNPAIGAGCILRTTNKMYDFSLRQRFAQQRQQLAKELHGESAAAKQEEPKQQQAPPQQQLQEQPAG